VNLRRTPNTDAADMFDLRGCSGYPIVGCVHFLIGKIGKCQAAIELQGDFKGEMDRLSWAKESQR
jgi:hypothetical protein